MRLSLVTSLLKNGRLKELHQILSTCLEGGKGTFRLYIILYRRNPKGKNPKHGQVNPTSVPDGQPSVESFNSTYFTCCTAV